MTFSLIYNKACPDRPAILNWRRYASYYISFVQNIFYYWLIFFKTLPSSLKTCFICHSFAAHWSRLLVSQQWQHHSILEPHCQCCQIHADCVQIWLQHLHEAQHQQHQPDHPRLGCGLALCRLWSCLGPRGQRGRKQFVRQPDNA